MSAISFVSTHYRSYHSFYFHRFSQICLHRITCLILLQLTAFRYQKNQYNVFEVNQTGYDNCTLDSAVGNWSSGKDFILLNKTMRYYFICGNGQCLNGMKVSVLVHPLPPPPTSSQHNHSTPSSAASMVLDYLGLNSLFLSFAFVLFGFVLVQPICHFAKFSFLFLLLLLLLISSILNSLFYESY